MHIEDKKSLYKNFYKTLKPGGQLLVTDYCWGAMVG
jgi:predicted methyltransferase